MNDGMKMILAVLVTAVVCTAGTYVLVGSEDSEGRSSISIEGSTSIQPLMDLYSEEFEKYANVTLNIQGGGSGVGVSSAASGKADIGMVSRDLKSSELGMGLVVTQIGLDAVVVIVNSDVKDLLSAGLTLDELKGIFSGTITNWNQINGVSADKAINPIIRESGSGTRDCFDSITGATVPDTAQWPSLSSTGAVVQQVNSTPGGIGYISMGSVTPEVNVVDVDGVSPSIDTVYDGSYTLQRNLILVTKGEPQDNVQFLLNWIVSEQGQKILENAGFIPLKN